MDNGNKEQLDRYDMNYKYSSLACGSVVVANKIFWSGIEAIDMNDPIVR